MPKILLFSLFLLSIIYTGNISKNAIAVVEQKKCLKKLDCFIRTYRKPGPCSDNLSKECKSAYHDLLEYNPVISKYISSSLSYNRGVFENHQASIFLYGELLMIRNKSKYHLLGSLNPISAFKIFLQLPVIVLSWMGFHIKDKNRGLVNAASWAINILLEYFGKEIKALIISIF